MSLARNTDPSTSHEAMSAPTATQLEALVLDVLRKHPDGLTTEQLAEITDISLVTVSPRLRPLTNKGFVGQSGRRQNRSGRSAIVWKAL